RGADGPAPGRRDEGYAGEPAPVDPARRFLGGGPQAVLGVLRRLALSEAHVVGHEDPPALGEPRDHPAIEIAPGRLAVEADDGLGARRALVDVVHAEGARGAACRDLVKAGCVGPGGVEGLVRGNHGAIRYTLGSPLPAGPLRLRLRRARP